MNNKLDKKQTTKITQSKNKKKIKSGGAFSITSFFSKNKSVESINKIELQPLLISNNAASSVSTNQQKHNKNKNQQSPPEVPPPNAQPQGFNTIKSTSRCSIL